MLILGVESSTPSLSVAVGDGKIVEELFFYKKNSHSENIHNAIIDILKLCNKTLEEVDLFAVSAGPGSYTGLRIGFSTLHGFASALNKPIVSVNTLEAMVFQVKKDKLNENFLLAPMIDARRMEVYNLITKFNGEVIVPPRSIVIDEKTFCEYNQPIAIFGDGVEKCLDTLSCDFHYIKNSLPKAKSIVELAAKKYNKDKDHGIPQPCYLKEVYIR